ncbi:MULTISPECIES: hypothetical protein [unclassified Photorhabdus]|uniref:hypothetical protein n=1 Tax=unclassified Photorhabdus TaxID=2620880 RepID=UPI000DCC9A5D|nr:MULTISPECIES: hypothetical protein [unclassified Photorhabdus]RAW91264.1 hypothetical protein CKY03_24230 [Photorhabdus sp. S9-53]RAW91269.1 hypothetical protein CKY05_24165 [Photorhabdus sp. S10-54]RAW94972.1 hypothetical protein CKY04_24245 [Photorhabdus sp. S8-52]
MEIKEILERFKKDTKDHSIKILHNEDLYRHLRFSKDGSSAYYFDIVTWPGYLCISGDMGCFTFSRVTDMFHFFRSSDDELSINPYYWSEKLQAGAGHCKKIYQGWSLDKFKDAVSEAFSNWLDNNDDISDDVLEEIQESIEEIISCSYDEYDAISAIRNYDDKHDIFIDFCENDLMEYQFYYIWCCYAIAWGISKFDEYIAENK